MRHSIRKEVKRFICFIMTMIMVLTSMPVNLLAAGVDYNDLSNNKTEIVNSKLPVEVAKPETGKTAADLITNPDQPKIYTLRTDYKVPKNGENKINYQPYVASVGENATDAEKAKVNKDINLPDLKGYVKPKNSYNINFQDIVDKAKNPERDGFNFLGTQEFVYGKKQSSVKIVHKFQKLEDFNKYEENQNVKPTQETGYTGSVLEVNPINDSRIEGFEPEADVLPVLVPEDTSKFEVEFRYNRKTYEVNFDTDGGSSIPTRLVYFEQVIPTVEQPTKVGSEFVGWKPSVDLKDEKGKTFKANELIKDSSGEAIKDLKANVKMPASNVTFTADWKDKPKADYVIQFWTEKPDYNDKDDSLDLRDRYDFIGARRIDNADTGSTPKLTDLDIHGITFPDLNDGRLEKAQESKEEFERYYFLNKDLTKKQNASKDNPEVQKSVLSTGETVYNVYYDRRVYTLYFTSINDKNDDYAYWPIITKDGQVLGKEGSPYKVSARFNQSLDKIWPKDEEISGLPQNHTSDPIGDDGLIGWMINNNNVDYSVQIFRDTPPYRLSAEDFVDAEDVMGTDDEHGNGHADKIPIGENQTKDRGEYEISLGASYLDTAVIHHVDIIKDDFNGKEQIDYDMSYWKSDTNAVTYDFILPHLQGFTLKEETREAKWIGFRKNDDVEKTFDELNTERNAKTPFRSDADKIEYISHFPWSEKSFNGTNAYNYANYSRNKYRLKLNNDPKKVKNDSEYTLGEDLFDVYYEMPLNDLQVDTKKVPQKPDWVPADWSFVGWALDPAGDNLVKDGNETKLHYDQVLYAKWGEPNRYWTVTVDPAEGKMRDLKSTDIVKEKVTVDGKEYPVKEPNQGEKQIFKLNHKQQLKDLPKPTRQGYDFLGWEWVRHNEDGTVDRSYRDTYHVPELYPFGNDVVGDVYLKAIWVENNRVDLVAYHHFIGDDGMELKDALKKVPIVNMRAGQYTSASGFYQNEDWILASPEELVNSPDDSVKEQYKEYNDRVGFDNTDFHTMRVEPAKIPNENGDMVENPNAKNNVFHFYYRHFKTRNYKVNYLDERAKAELEKATPEAKKDIIKNYSIIPQENVVSKNRHYDARNYRPIPGWKLVSDPQQQLFYDVDDETGEFLGINKTGSDEITFYYKDVRVIEVPKDGKTPDGYVRVTFMADKGGSFGNDEQGNPITELNYDVIEGLKSDLLPVPKLMGEGETADQNKHYITPEDGKKFTKWDNSPLLNDNTIINDDHSFTAYFEWSGLTAKGMVRTEAFEDPDGNWTNDFAPTIDDLKEQLVWKEKDQVKQLPEGTKIQFFDEDGNELTTNDDVFNLVKEANKPDKDEVVRTVNIKVKATFPDKKDPQELTIPITVYKNVYEALTGTEKPLFLSQAENGELKDITGEYVKVTVAPTGDMTSKDNKVYYVNPKAWVNIPEVNTDDSTKFLNWTADKDAQNENGIYDFTKRHKFTEDTVISPAFANDVVEQKDPDKKPDVPNNYVKVIVKTTDKATDATAFEKTFWVNPTTEVAIDVTNPTGKTVAADPAKVGAVGYTMTFSKWKSNETTARVWTDKIVGKFENETTIVAKYTVTPEKIKDQVPTTDTVHTPQGKTPTVDELKAKITPPEGKTISKVTIVENPDVNNPGESKAKVIVEYTDGSSVGTKDKPLEIPVKVHEPIVKANPDGSKPTEALENYVKVIFKAGTGGTVSGDLVYYVSPEVEVDMTESAGKIIKTPNVGYLVNGEKWTNKDNKALKGTFADPETEFVYNFVKDKDIVEKTDDPNQVIPKGYVKVTFKTEDENKGKLAGDVKEKIYYVNPKAEIKLVELADGQTAGEKQLAVPKTAPAANYEFEGWVEDIDTETAITSERIHVAKFRLAKVTLTYDKGGDDVTGDVPEVLKVDHGTKVRLAGPGKLAKPNATFAGWKIGDKTYQAGDEVTLNENTTAIAQWTTSKHTVTFNTMGGTDVPSQEVVHGDKLKAVTPPTQKDKVFMGWKEQGKENEEAYFDLTSAINEDKTLIAQWQDPVQKIDENATVEDQFIKVTFKEGAHGKLKLGADEQTTPVIYKVAKGYTFDQAKGLKVPEILPNKYYKAKAENSGWDKALDLTLEQGETEKVFTAQYEPEADVIPVDPKVTEEDQIKKEKPEGMVLVTYKVTDDTKLYIPNNSKYYVKKEIVVRIPTPVVLTKTNDAVFDGWKNVNVVIEPLDPENTDPNVEKFIWVKQSFKEDTVISDEKVEEIELKIKKPSAGDKRIYIEQMTADAIGKLELIRDGNVIETATNSKFRRKYDIFRLNEPLQSGDLIRYWQEGPSRISDKTTEIVN